MNANSVFQFYCTRHDEYFPREEYIEDHLEHSHSIIDPRALYPRGEC